MRCLKVSADETGASRFDEVEIPQREVDFAPPAAPMLLSEPIGVEHILFTTLQVGWDGSWHPTPARQYFIMLAGQLEVEVSGGERRRMLPGDMVLLQDMSGMGHLTRVIGDEQVAGLFVQLPAA